MDWLRRLKLGQRLLLLLVAFSLGFLAYGVWTYRTLQTVQVGGPLYERIEANQNLLSDVLPPPAYIIESYLTCLQIVAATDSQQQGLLVDRLRQLQANYLERHQHWMVTPLDPALADTLLRQAHTPALAFYAQVDREFLPAVFRSDCHQHGILQELALAERAPGFRGDALLFVKCAELPLLEARVELDLVHRRKLARFLKQAAKLLDREIRNSDGPN